MKDTKLKMRKAKRKFNLQVSQNVGMRTDPLNGLSVAKKFTCGVRGIAFRNRLGVFRPFKTEQYNGARS